MSVASLSRKVASTPTRRCSSYVATSAMVLLGVVRVGGGVVEIVERVHHEDRERRYECLRAAAHRAVAVMEDERQVDRQQRPLPAANAMQRRGHERPGERGQRTAPCGQRRAHSQRRERMGEGRSAAAGRVPAAPLRRRASATLTTTRRPAVKRRLLKKGDLLRCSRGRSLVVRLVEELAEGILPSSCR